MPGEDSAGSGGPVAIIGGTGAMGRGLARRLALAGTEVVLGSRDAGRAREVAARLSAATGGDIRGATNDRAARQGDPVVVTVPWTAHAEVLGSLRNELAGRLVVDCVNPLAHDGQGAYAVRVAEGSAAQQAAALLPGSVVTGAFHHVPAAWLSDQAVDRLDSDVLVVGDDDEACRRTVALVALVPGLTGVRAGGLRAAGAIEALTASLIFVDAQGGAPGGVRLGGLRSRSRS